MNTAIIPQAVRLSHSRLPRCPSHPLHSSTNRHASTSTKGKTLDKSRILSKPPRFNPPSHASRRIRPKMYPGPDLNATQRAAQAAKKYPNMFPPEGSWGFWFLTQRRLHVWITLSTLFSLAAYSISRSFLATTIYRSELPSSSDFKSHPFQSLGQLLHVYKLHVQYESEQVAEKRRRKLEDADKRKEFMRAHGVEPGFLTGSWMEKFGTVEGDRVREGLAAEGRVDGAVGDVMAMSEGSPVTGDGEVLRGQVQSQAQTRRSDARRVEQMRKVTGEAGGPENEEEKRKPRRWLGIW